QESAEEEMRCMILTLDSLGFTHDDVVDILARYLRAEAVDKQKAQQGRNARGRKVLVKGPVQMPMQTNSFDCGVYLVHFLGTFLSDMDYYGQVIRKVSSRPMTGYGLLIETKTDQTATDARKQWQMEEIDALRGRLTAEILKCAEEWRAWRKCVSRGSKSEEQDEVEIVGSSMDHDVTYIL
ncbi:hypothetical protein BDZ89DRAFT_958044, partial [Hymenopellis radicata]